MLKLRNLFVRRIPELVAVVVGCLSPAASANVCHYQTFLPVTFDRVRFAAHPPSCSCFSPPGDSEKTALPIRRWLIPDVRHDVLAHPYDLGWMIFRGKKTSNVHPPIFCLLLQQSEMFALLNPVFLSASRADA